jgi:hypothetical protein
LEEENAKHILLDCRDTRNWRMKLINDKRLNMNKEVAYRKMFKNTTKKQVNNVGKYSDIVKSKWLNKIKTVNIL